MPKTKKTAWNKLSFKISGEFLTNISRNLWAEGNGVKAINILVKGIVGFNEEYAIRVCTGKAKLIGVNDYKLEDDDAKFDNRGLPLMNLCEFLAKDLEESNKEIAKIVNRTCELIPSYSPLLALPEALQDIPIEPTKEYQFWHDGWLSPDGKFYGCECRQHVTLAHQLGFEEGDLEEVGWLKLQRPYHWIRPWKFLEKKSGKITQAQLDVLFDWSQVTKMPMEDWMTE